MRYFLLIFCLISLSASAAWGEASLVDSKFPSLMSSIKITAPVDFCGEPVPIDDPEVYERLEKELLLFMWRRSQIILWVKRTGRYMPHIEKRLKAKRMPDDLKYVPIVESSLLPHIGSSKHAIGYWQFIRATGLRFGLTINSDVDERRNIFKSTEAAIRYFKKLYNDFGSWTLAAAAYNMGETGLQSNINFQKTKDFYRLYLPLETQAYILRIVAAKIILSNPEKYGFHFNQQDYYVPMDFERVEVRCPGKTAIQYIAEAAGTYYKTIKELNPELRGRYLSAGTYSVALPNGSSKKFHKKFKQLVEAQKAKVSRKPSPSAKKKSVKKAKKKKKKRIYVVKRGDSLSRIAARFHVKTSDILKWNHLNRRKHIYPGQRLIIGY